MPLLRSPRVGREQDVNRLFLPGFFHGPNRSSPLAVNFGDTRNGFNALGRGWPRSSDVGQSLRSADQGVADHGRRLDGRTNAFHFQANVEIKAMNHADQWASPLFSQPLGEMSDRPQGMANHDVRPPLTKLLFHPFPTSADAGDRQSWIRVVRESKKSGHQGGDLVMHPPSWGL